MRPEYHVSCGISGKIYAGETKHEKDGFVFTDKCEVTEEAIQAVVTCMRSKLEDKGKTMLTRRYTFNDETVVELVAKIKKGDTDNEDSDH